MLEDDIFIIRMNIARYRAMLKLGMDCEKRVLVERLLAETEESLLLASNWNDERPR